jgi:NAD+ synthase (glutamine-hydrolysing)
MEMFEFYRTAACVPDMRVGDVTYNKEQILEKLKTAYDCEAGVIAFPELALCGYTCQDLFFQSSLLQAVNLALAEIIYATRNHGAAVVVGAPVQIQGQLYNGAYVLMNGAVCGITLKTFLPNYNEFYEKRWFSSASQLNQDTVSLREIGICLEEDGEEIDYEVPVGNQILYNIDNEIRFGVEICEDVWAPLTPSTWLALSGAELIINISASNETISKRDYRKSLIKAASASNMCEYLYVSAGAAESTQDLIFSGHSMMCENGTLLHENKDFIANDYIMLSDFDLGKIRSDRRKGKTFADTAALYPEQLRKTVTVTITDCSIPTSDGEYYIISDQPFIPTAKARRLKRCSDIFDMQVGGLVKRLSVTGCKPVLGVSGGMDSTLALLVCAKALKKMNRPSTDLIAITMPAFGTTDRTYNNSLILMKSLGATVVTIPIKEACLQHFKDIGHDESVKDITYENTQARERTQVLMDYANKVNGLVVGTGDLSELALGWCTYNADQMSMYGVNASIPKTLVRWMIDSVIEHEIFPDSTVVLRDILDTPISPELLPPDEEGNITQKTEDKVGPYELHDFFLYYMMRYGFSPKKIFYLAKKAFRERYAETTILKWMNTFYKRFFTQQFKRSCMPDGVKVGSVCLSPRGDWRMPSDASYALWLGELEGLTADQA